MTTQDQWQVFKKDNFQTWPSEENMPYLIWVSYEYGNGNRAHIAIFNNDAWQLRDSHGGNINDFVTHWHYLPKPPK